MEPPLFSAASLFSLGDASDDAENGTEDAVEFVERIHQFPGMKLSIREFTFHEVNANLLWPGTFSFAEWLVVHHDFLRGKKILELGSGTGALSIFLKKSFGVTITTSDFDDEVIEENIAHNCRINGIEKLAHLRHTWGNPLPRNLPNWEIVLASDILLYVKQYPNLIKTLITLLENSNAVNCDPIFAKEQNVCMADSDTQDLKLDLQNMHLPKKCFLMSWRRRLPKEDEASFFNCCRENGLHVQHLGSRIYCIFRNTLQQGIL